jgi:hypothetical protein
MLEQHAVVVADTEGVTQIWSPGAEGLSAAVGRVVAGVAARGGRKPGFDHAAAP